MNKGSIALGILVGFVACKAAEQYHRQRQDVYNTSKEDIVDGVAGLIGNTPLMRIQSLSEATGCEILAKAEFLNPGGSPKDRVALSIVNHAEALRLIHPHTGSTIFEGTVGSTGISIAMIARARGYKAWICMPDDQSQEKYDLLEKLGAHVEKVRPASIVDKGQFVNLAKKRAVEFGKDNSKDTSSVAIETIDSGSMLATDSRPTGFFADQFENLANFDAHYKTTGPEIYRQSGGKLDVFVAGSGTGGTIAGITSYLKKVMKVKPKIYLADPQGSGLFNRVKHGIMYAPEEKEGTRRRHQVDTVVEGIGINRLTRNFNKGEGGIDDAIKVTDAEAVAMSRYLVERDGLFVGSSSAVNCVAAVKIAKQLGPSHRIVTILCDSGIRHTSKFWNDSYLTSHGVDLLPWDDLAFVK